MSEEKKETVSEIIDFMYEFGGNVEKEYAKRLRKALESNENKDDDRELITELWRSGKNIGARFIFKGKDIVWQNMTKEQKEEVIANMLSMGDFFYKILKEQEGLK